MAGRIPAAIVAEQPWLLFWRGWIAERHVDRQCSLGQAFTAFRRKEDTTGMFLAWAGVIFGYLSEGVLVPMDRWIALLDDIMRDAPEFPSKGVETRVAVAMLVAITMRHPSHHQAAHWAERAIEVAWRHPDQIRRRSPPLTGSIISSRPVISPRWLWWSTR